MTAPLWALAGWWLGGGCLVTVWLLWRRSWAARLIERAYDQGWEDGREPLLAPETQIRLIPVPAPVPGRPGAAAPPGEPRRDRPYLNGSPPDWRADIGTGWTLGTIWAPPWALIDRLPPGSWLRALLAQATTMPPHKALR